MIADCGTIHEFPTLVPFNRCGFWLQYRFTVSVAMRSSFAAWAVVWYFSEKLIDTDIPSKLNPLRDKSKRKKSLTRLGNLR